MKKNLIILITILGILILPKLSFAIGLPVQPLNNSTQEILGNELGINAYYELYHVGSGTILTSFSIEQNSPLDFLTEISDGTWTGGLDLSAGTSYDAGEGYWTVVSSTIVGGYKFTYTLTPELTFTNTYFKANFDPSGVDVTIFGYPSSTLTDNVAGLIQHAGSGYSSSSFEFYICTNGNCGGGGGGSSTLEFLYPTNGTTTPDFNNYSFTATNLTSTDLYYISVNTIVPQITNGTTQSGNLNGGSIQTYGTLVTHPYFNLSITGTSTTEIAQATLYDITNFQIPDNLNNFIVATATSEFTQILNGGNGTTTYYYVTNITNASGTTSVVLNPITNPNIAPLNPSSTVACSQWNIPSSGIFDIGNGLLYAGCQLINYAIFPSPNYTQALASSTQNFQNIFPFNIYFGVVEGVQSDLNEYNVPTSTTLSLGVQGINGQEINMITITSSTTVNALTQATNSTIFGYTQGCSTSCATEAVNNLYLPFKMGIWIIAGIKIVSMITTI